MQWGQDATRPYLDLVPGLGFLKAVWLELAHQLCQLEVPPPAAPVYVCDACKRSYERRERKPQQGRRNYCPTCGRDGHNKAAKRRWWEENHGTPERKTGSPERPPLTMILTPAADIHAW